MQSHPHAQRPNCSPVGCQQRLLGLERCDDGVDRPRKWRMHPITSHLDDDAALCGDRLLEDRIVASESIGHRLRVLLPQLRAAFDVGE
jgi:hypothetical protein